MSEDILERAKKALIDDDMTYEDYDECISLLIAEVERLRSQSVEQVFRRKNEEIATKDARIKELEADRIEARAQYLLFLNDNPGCIAWNFDELEETQQDALRQQARYTLELEEPWAYVQLREAREQIKRLEAAFLKAEKASKIGHIQEMQDKIVQGLDLCHEEVKRKIAGPDKGLLTAEQREALEKIRSGKYDDR